MNKKGNFIIAIDLGGTNLRAALFDLRLRLKRQLNLDTKSFTTKKRLLQGLIGSINSIICGYGLSREDILGVGIGLPGPVDTRRGVVHFLPNIKGWNNVKLKDLLESDSGLPVFLDNDAKLMALAEYRFGSARGVKNAICITLGTGVGGALILEGRIFRGADNAAGEIGHLPINENGPLCACGGRACLEAYVGNNRIIEQARPFFADDIGLEELSLLAKKGDKRAMRVWSAVGTRLGVALTGLVNLLNLDAVIIGGGVAKAGKVLFQHIKNTIRQRAMKVQRLRVKVLRAKLGPRAGIIGAALLVRERPGL